MAPSPPGATIVLRGPTNIHSVIDGDTSKVAGLSIRLHGIDAPEVAQTCDGWPAGEAAHRSRPW